MELIKTSEKILIWMYRNKITQQQIADTLGISRQYLARKMSDNIFTVPEIMRLKSLGFKG